MPNKWTLFGDRVANQLGRVKRGETVLVLVDTDTDPELADAVLAGALVATSNAQLLRIRRMPPHEASELNDAITGAMMGSDVIISICDSRVNQTEASRKARQSGSRMLSTEPAGIADFLIAGTVDVDYEKMAKNGKIVADMWEQGNHCRVKCDAGTDITFELGDRPVLLGDGICDEEGILEFFPGMQVSIAPIETSINGVIAADASVWPGGLVSAPVLIDMENGKIKNVRGGSDAVRWHNWLKSTGEPMLFELCHFTLGLNPRAQFSGNMIEDERVVGSVTFGFGSQDPSFGGNVGTCRHHVDVVLTGPAVYVDDKLLAYNNELAADAGFVDMM